MKLIAIQRAVLATALALAAVLVLATGAQAVPKYLGDGAKQNANGGWDLPAQGTCPAGALSGYTGIDTRPECVALRVTGTCSGNYASASGGVCNDLVNTTQPACAAAPDRLWNPSTSVCSIVMFGDDRNNVVCALHGGSWVTGAAYCTGNWIMPARGTTNPLLTSNGPGDQCLRCHNAETQYNGPRVRDTENTLYTGHKNMARKVAKSCSLPGYFTQATCEAALPTAGVWDFMPWGGPPFACDDPAPPDYFDEQTCEAAGYHWNPTQYPRDDSGNLFDWAHGEVSISGTARSVAWIYGDWLAPLPRVIAKLPASSSQVCSDPRYTTANCVANGGVLLNNAGASYSCARCHTTGWTSDATIQTTKEPEASFPLITWDRISNAPADVVNLSGGVLNDANKYSSWDEYGITCTRCHNSAIDTATCTGTPPLCTSGSTIGMSSHHNNLTAPDTGGNCTEPRFTAEAQCEAAGALWKTACSIDNTAGICVLAANTQAKCNAVSGGIWSSLSGWCSANFYTDETSCVAANATWTSGWCYNADAQGSCSGGSGDAAENWRTNGHQASCMLGGGTYTLGRCSLGGVCNKNPGANLTPATCTADGGQWAAATDIVRCLDIHEYGKEHDIAALEAAAWTGTNTIRGQIITRLCMDCHRQETSGEPYADTTATPDASGGNHPGMYLKVGPAHGTVAPVSHPAGNMFLNSPHGKFTGTFNQVATGTFNWGMTGAYKSIFLTDGEAANTGNGCTGCHDVHESVVPETSPFPAIREECTECHAGPYNVSLDLIKHPSGIHTPIEDKVNKPAEACVVCHMPEGQHLWRVNSSGSYSNYPAAALTAVVNANASPDGVMTNAVWVDLDHSCGQCHGGGSNRATTTGTVAAASKVLTVASSVGFATGQKIRIAGAGALEGDGLTREDFDTYIVSVPNATTINLAGGVTVGVTGAVVKQNPLGEGVNYYFTKNQLVGYATGMHPDRTPAQGVVANFTATPTGLAVAFDGSASTCGGSAANCDTYTWDFGDGASATGVTASHTYGAAGTYVARLTVVDTAPNPDGTNTAIKTLTLAGAAPAASGSCSFNALTWTMTATNTSTVPNGMKQVVITWGQGLTTNDLTPTVGETYARKYVVPGTFPIDMSVLDNAGKTGRVRLCTTNPANFTYYAIAGTVRDSAAVGLSGAAIKVYKAGSGTAMRTLTSGVGGAFNITGLAPNTYILIVTKATYTFPPVPDQTVGPSVGGLVIQAN